MVHAARRDRSLFVGEPHGAPPEPFVVRCGLAVFRLGSGPPVLLMPGPHRYQQPGDGTAGPLITGLLGIGRRMLSFDPPRGGRSIRPAQLGLEEMLACADETLEACGVEGPVDALGHSMAGLVLLAYALARPERIRRLVLVSTGAGGPAYTRAPGALWNRSHPGFWGLAALGILATLWPRRGSELALLNYIKRRSFLDRRLVAEVPRRAGDWLRPKQGMPEWHRVAVKLDFGDRLQEIGCPTLVLCGRHDPQFPVACSRQLADGIMGARLDLFERSGHFPFMEEPRAFWGSVERFLAPSP